MDAVVHRTVAYSKPVSRRLLLALHHVPGKVSAGIADVANWARLGSLPQQLDLLLVCGLIRLILPLFLLLVIVPIRLILLLDLLDEENNIFDNKSERKQ